VWYVVWAATAVVFGGVGPSVSLCALVTALTCGLNMYHGAHPSWYALALVWKGGMLYGAIHGWWRSRDVHWWVYDVTAIGMYLAFAGADLPYFTDAMRHRLRVPLWDVIAPPRRSVLRRESHPGGCGGRDGALPP
jgi:hypothetical protein